MNVTIPIPDDFAARFGSEAELGRRALEALAIEEHRAGRMTLDELQRVLGLADASEFDGFLRSRGVAAAEPFVESMGGGNIETAADDLVARFQAFAARHTLGGLDIKELISEGRR